jgi:hypothetical protein
MCINAEKCVKGNACAKKKQMVSSPYTEAFKDEY